MSNKDNINTVIQKATENIYLNEKLSFRRETAQCFVSVNIVLSHSR